MASSYMQVNGVNIEAVTPGVVVLDETPYYYIEYVKGDIGGTVIAYNFSKESMTEYINKLKKDNVKDYSLLQKDSLIKRGDKYKVKASGGATDLTKAIAKKLGKKNKVTIRKRFYSAPIFVAPVSMANDTVTNNYQQGFYEVEKAQVGGLSNNHYPAPVFTGAFIGFNHVFWKDTIISVKEWGNFIADLYLTYGQYYFNKK